MKKLRKLLRRAKTLMEYESILIRHQKGVGQYTKPISRPLPKSPK